MRVVIACCLFLAMSFSSRAQSWKALGADELFSIARSEVFEGDRAEGRKKLAYILEKSPGYDEVRIMLARTYAWDALYDEARKELRAVLERDPNREALDALIDVELWSARYGDALLLAESGLAAHPNDESFLYKQASALASLERNKEALMCLNALLQMNPTHEKGMALYKIIRLDNLKHTATVTYGADFFSRIFDPAHYASVQLSRTNSWGSSHVRLNYANRFNTSGSQLEADLYPKIGKGVYAYINYAYSGSALFPGHRAGAEFFFKLPQSLETSVGIRYMDFGRDRKVVMYTGSVGWYFRNYWLSARPYVAPDPKGGTSVSATVLLRRYLSSAENYIGLSAGFGFSPDMGRIQNSAGFSENAIHLLSSQRVGLMYQKVLRLSWEINVAVEISRQELQMIPADDVVIFGSCLAVRRRF
jgi:YaiO family outer membrane protein